MYYYEGELCITTTEVLGEEKQAPLANVKYYSPICQYQLCPSISVLEYIDVIELAGNGALLNDMDPNPWLIPSLGEVGGPTSSHREPRPHPRSTTSTPAKETPDDVTERSRQLSAKASVHVSHLFSDYSRLRPATTMLRVPIVTPAQPPPQNLVAAVHPFGPRIFSIATRQSREAD